MARAKQTDRSEARRRYRQTQDGPADDDAPELDFGERKTDIGTGNPSAPAARDARPASGRLGFGAAFRGAYHPAHIREDLRALPMLLRTRAFLAAALLVLGGTVAAFAFWNYTGGRFAWELTVLPGSALAPQLVAGFFAPRASYLLGLLVGLIQGIAATVFLTQLAVQLGAPLPAEQVPALLSQAFVTGPVAGAFFAAAAAWYRRFLALSSPRRDSGRGSSRQTTKGNPSRRPAGR